MSIKFTKIKMKAEQQLVQELYNKSVPAHEKSYFGIEELYRVNKEVYPLIGNLLSSVTKKQIQKK